MNEPEIIVLPFERWQLVEPIVREAWRNAMPVTPKQSTFLTALEGEKVAAVIQLESLLNLCIYVAPEHRRTSLLPRMIRECEARLQQMKGFSAIAFPDSQSHIKMYQRMGAREIDTSLGAWRKDY